MCVYVCSMRKNFEIFWSGFFIFFSLLKRKKNKKKKNKRGKLCKQRQISISASPISWRLHLFLLFFHFDLTKIFLTNACIIIRPSSEEVGASKRESKISLMATQIFCLLFFYYFPRSFLTFYFASFLLFDFLLLFTTTFFFL